MGLELDLTTIVLVLLAIWLFKALTIKIVNSIMSYSKDRLELYFQETEFESMKQSDELSKKIAKYAQKTENDRIRSVKRELKALKKLRKDKQAETEDNA